MRTATAALTANLAQQFTIPQRSRSSPLTPSASPPMLRSDRAQLRADYDGEVAKKKDLIGRLVSGHTAETEALSADGRRIRPRLRRRPRDREVCLVFPSCNLGDFPDTSERRPLPRQYFFHLLIEGNLTQQRDAIALLGKSNSITYKVAKGVHAFPEANAGKEMFYAMMPIHTEKGLLAVEPQAVQNIGPYVEMRRCGRSASRSA